MALFIQVLIWIVGIGVAIYIAVFQMFIGGLVDVFVSISDIIKDVETDGVAKDLAWGFAKMIFASLTGWFIILATSLVSAFVGEYLD